MIPRHGFSLNIEISGNMINQRNPLPHKSASVTSVQVLLFIYIPGQKCLRMQVSQTRIFFTMFDTCFKCLWDVMEMSLLLRGNACSPFSPTEFDRNLIKIMVWSSCKIPIIPRLLKGKRVRKTENIIIVYKIMILTVRFSLWIEIFAKMLIRQFIFVLENNDFELAFTIRYWNRGHCFKMESLKTKEQFHLMSHLQIICWSR